MIVYKFGCGAIACKDHMSYLSCLSLMKGLEEFSVGLLCSADPDG